ncbi:MAG: hypothetical protein Q4D81_07295 [Eubacteriales bacterium]|nr:hypothetical protein [Eubacteriales bacterium]
MTVLLFLISGCAGKEANTKGTAAEAEKPETCTETEVTAAEAGITETCTGTDEMTGIEMTETEKKLLIDLYGEKDRIEKGDLYSYQKEALNQLRAGRNYLEQRYPTHVFTLESIDPGSRLRPWAELRFRENESRSFLAKIKPGQEGKTYVCEDNYYGYLLQEAYDARIEEILADAGFQVRSYTIFLSTIGEVLDPAATVDELLACAPKLNRETSVYVSDAVPDRSHADEMQRVLNKAGMVGSYWVYYTGQDIGMTVRELEEGKSQWESLFFSCVETD